MKKSQLLTQEQYKAIQDHNVNFEKMTREIE